MKSRSKVEQKAITILRMTLDKVECIIHSIPEQNTEISWDGEIKLYKNEDVDDKANFTSTIKIQVKGRTDKISVDAYSFSIERRDLENYLKENGTIFFVVVFNKKGEYKVFYADLLPFNLNRILTDRANEGKKKIKVKCKELIDNPKIVEKILREFETNRKYQSRISENVFDKSKLGVMANSNDTRMKFFDWNIGKGYSLLDLVGSDKYIYSFDNNDNIVSINYANILSITQTCAIKVMSKSKDIYYDELKIEHTKKGNIVRVGTGIIIYLNENKFNIKIRGTLSDRIKILDFVKNIYEENGFYINDDWLGLQSNSIDMEKISIDIDMYNVIKGFMDTHSINKDIDLDKWDENDFKRLFNWIDAIDSNTESQIDNFNSSIMGSIKIKDLRFSVLAGLKPNGRFWVESIWNNPEGKKYRFIYGNPEDKNSIKTNDVFDVLNKEAYLSDDINFEEMKKHYNGIVIDREKATLINFQVLELILAYDENGNDGLLNYAEYLLEKIEKIDDLKEVAFINKCQIKKRQNKLGIDDKRRLLKIKEQNLGLIFDISVNILIDNKDEAKIQFESLNDEEKGEYLKFPISKYLVINK